MHKPPDATRTPTAVPSTTASSGDARAAMARAAVVERPKSAARSGSVAGSGMPARLGSIALLDMAPRVAGTRMAAVARLALGVLLGGAARFAVVAWLAGVALLVPVGAVAQPAAHLVTAPDAPSPSAWRWPLDGAVRVVRRFDPPADPYGAGHRGVDLAASLGAPVRAAGAGVVLFAGPVGGRGVVSVTHADGSRTTYEPVRPSVRARDPVSPGTVLGHLDAGHLGCPVDACLHWGLIVAGGYADPLTLLGLGRVRLYPVTT